MVNTCAIMVQERVALIDRQFPNPGQSGKYDIVQKIKCPGFGSVMLRSDGYGAVREAIDLIRHNAAG